MRQRRTTNVDYKGLIGLVQSAVTHQEFQIANAEIYLRHVNEYDGPITFGYAGQHGQAAFYDGNKVLFFSDVPDYLHDVETANHLLRVGQHATVEFERHVMPLIYGAATIGCGKKILSAPPARALTIAVLSGEMNRKARAVMRKWPGASAG